jgi:predicted Zn-dependent peptidase
MQKKEILKDEFIFETTLKNGLKVYLHPKRKFVQAFAALQIGFGGRDFRYLINDETQELPKGTAHFLEHMLFENNGSTLSDFFIDQGADINAYTSRKLTSYYFSTRDNFTNLLKRLLDNFVDFNFSETSVKKERKIITQELSMNDDSFSVKAYKTLLKMMYKDESIYEDIGGSQKTIKDISIETLRKATTDFYHPKNMTLVLTGNFDKDEVITMLNTHPFVLKTWHDYQEITHKTDLSDKSKHIYKREDSTLDTNIVEVGIKIPEAIFNDLSLDHNIITNSFFSMIFSPASPLYKVLKKKKLHNFTFSASPVIEDDYGFFNISIETKKVKLFSKTIQELLLDLPNMKFDEQIFKAYKRADIGRAIKAFDDVKLSHSLVKRLINDGVDLYTFVEKSKNITFEDFLVYQNIFTKNNIYIVEYLSKPLNKKKNK